MLGYYCIFCWNKKVVSATYYTYKAKWWVVFQNKKVVYVRYDIFRTQNFINLSKLKGRRWFIDNFTQSYNDYYWMFIIRSKYTTILVHWKSLVVKYANSIKKNSFFIITP